MPRETGHVTPSIVRSVKEGKAVMVQRIVPDDGNRTSQRVRVRTEAKALRRMNMRGGMEHFLVSQF